MFRFLHTSDWHLTTGPLFDDTVRVCEFIREIAHREKVDAVLHAGDWSHHNLPHRVLVPRERNYLRGWAARLTDTDYYSAKRIALVTLHGNHDIVGDLDCLEDIDGVRLVKRLEVINTGDGWILGLPFPHKRHYVAAFERATIETSRQDLIRTLALTVRTLGTTERPPRVPLVGLGHINIAGSTLGGGEQMIGHELELTPADLDESRCDYWALGHIHERQQIANQAWYCGTPQPQSFGDSNNNAVLLVELEHGKPPRVETIETPSVKFWTIDVRWDVAAGNWKYLPADAAPLELDGAVPAAGKFRLRIKAHSAEGEQPPYDQLERFAVENHADAWRIDRHIAHAARVRGTEIAAAHTIEDKVRAYWQTLDAAPADDDQAAALELLGELT